MIDHLNQAAHPFGMPGHPPFSAQDAFASADPCDLLDLQEIDTDRFRNRINLDNHVGRVFGGQQLALALSAAARTVPSWAASHAGGRFLRKARLGMPLEFVVERLVDSRSFAHRRVVASQGGLDVLEFQATFHEIESGPSREGVDIDDMPGAGASPAGSTGLAISSVQSLLRRVGSDRFPIEIIPLNPEAGNVHSRQDFWVRVPGAPHAVGHPANQMLTLLMSDYWLAAVAAAPHTATMPNLTIASLNHAIWFHAASRVDGWIAFRTESEWAGNGRGLARGTLLTSEGRMVATVVQEVLLRP